MNIIFVGAPGSGKGTQARKLIDKFNFVQLSTGDLLRESIKNETQIGILVKDIMDQGKLVPDETIVKLVENFIIENRGRSVIFDGFPRTVNQSKKLDEMLKNRSLKVDKVIYFKIDSNILIKRLTGRRTCSKCGEIYHEDTRPALKDVCAKCGGLVIQRADDKADVIEERLVQFEKNTGPTIDFYRKHGDLVEIDGALNPDIVFERINKILELAN